MCRSVSTLTSVRKPGNGTLTCDQIYADAVMPDILARWRLAGDLQVIVHCVD